MTDSRFSGLQLATGPEAGLDGPLGAHGARGPRPGGEGGPATRPRGPVDGAVRGEQLVQRQSDLLGEQSPGRAQQAVGVHLGVNTRPSHRTVNFKKNSKLFLKIFKFKFTTNNNIKCLLRNFTRDCKFATSS